MKKSIVGNRIQNFPAFLILITLVLCITWIQVTDFTEDDAFITFRFAEQLANGNGFVYNIDQPIYGTTTPFFTILLSLWMRFISPNVIFGARFFGVLALLGTQIFVWLTLKELNRSFAEQIFVLAAIAFSSKMIYMSIYGMEIPFVPFFMALSWYLYCRKQSFWTGIISGLLLLTRIDTALWPLLLFAFLLMENRKQAFLFLLGAGIIYLPWLYYATIQFGSPIPYTIIAKWTAYSRDNYSPYAYHLKTILEYLSPFSLIQKFAFVGPVIYFLPIFWMLGFRKKTISKPIFLLLLFGILEIILLTFTRASIFSRYFIPVLLVIVILFGIALGVIWQAVQSKPKYKYSMIILFSISFIAVFINHIGFITYVRERQLNRYENSLKQAGLWLNANTPESSTVLLEPLGYVGFYSERIMLDEVGLITPQVVELKRAGISADHYLEILKPDYTVMHCDEANYRSNQEGNYFQQYEMVQEFNPLDFKIELIGQYDDPYDQIRNSCYQIWERQ